MVKTVTLLGSTGSVGRQTLDVIALHPGRFQVVALTAQKNAELLAQQARQFHASFVAIADETQYIALKELLAGTNIEIFVGDAGVIDAARQPADCVVAAIVGAAGLLPTMAAIERGATIALANKEVMVCAGALVNAAVQKSGSVILPVDSEHNAIFQSLVGHNSADIHKIILTASGGPFRTKSMQEMMAVTIADALSHPVWKMGGKISIDSATMMNKGLELIEAHHLFHIPSEQIEIVVHPQSIMHSAVEYVDGSVIAQLGAPDMRTPIAYCLSYPDRIETGANRLSFTDCGHLEFFPPDPVRFPALRLARRAMEQGGAAPTVLNAANEVAVAAFLAGQLPFVHITQIVEKMMEKTANQPLSSMADVLEIDSIARAHTAELL